MTANSQCAATSELTAKRLPPIQSNTSDALIFFPLVYIKPAFFFFFKKGTVPVVKDAFIDKLSVPSGQMPVILYLFDNKMPRIHAKEACVALQLLMGKLDALLLYKPVTSSVTLSEVSLNLAITSIKQKKLKVLCVSAFTNPYSQYCFEKKKSRQKCFLIVFI